MDFVYSGQADTTKLLKEAGTGWDRLGQAGTGWDRLGLAPLVLADWLA